MIVRRDAPRGFSEVNILCAAFLVATIYQKHAAAPTLEGTHFLDHWTLRADGIKAIKRRLFA